MDFLFIVLIPGVRNWAIGMADDDDGEGNVVSALRECCDLFLTQFARIDAAPASA
jgi:hypothetical protein